MNELNQFPPIQFIHSIFQLRLPCLPRPAPRRRFPSRYSEQHFVVARARVRGPPQWQRSAVLRSTAQLSLIPSRSPNRQIPGVLPFFAGLDKLTFPSHIILIPPPLPYPCVPSLHQHPFDTMATTTTTTQALSVWSQVPQAPEDA